MNGIQDGVAVVTSGGSGIGRQLSLRFAEAGAKVVVADIDEEGGHKTVSMETPHYEEAVFESESPPKLVWECCDDLFETVISDYKPEP